LSHEQLFMLGAIVSADKKLSETAFVIVRKLLRKHFQDNHSATSHIINDK
jgi:hypothetical protein